MLLTSTSITDKGGVGDWCSDISQRNVFAIPCHDVRDFHWLEDLLLVPSVCTDLSPLNATLIDSFKEVIVALNQHRETCVNHVWSLWRKRHSWVTRRTRPKKTWWNMTKDPVPDRPTRECQILKPLRLVVAHWLSILRCQQTQWSSNLLKIVQKDLK